jgi:hypothetical protein
MTVASDWKTKRFRPKGGTGLTPFHTLRVSFRLIFTPEGRIRGHATPKGMPMRGILMVLAVMLAGCGSEPAAQQADPASAQEETKKATVDLTSKEAGCPFQNTSGWYAQVENNRFSVDGRVDLLMAGYKPVLTKRPSAGAGEAAFDLSLEAAPGGAVEPAVHYEEPMTRAYDKVTIYCGGEQVTSFGTMDQRLGLR